MLDGNIVEEIYAAAAEPDGLGKLVAITQNVMDIDSAGIWLIRNAEITAMVHTPDISESTGPYLAYYSALDPWSAGMSQLNEVTLGSELFDEDKLVQTEFYNDFACRFGMFRPMGVTLDVAPDCVARIATNRTEGRRFLGQRDKRRLHDLSIHLKGSLRLRERLQNAETYAGLLERSLNAFDFGCLTCDADGVVRYANVAASRLAQSGDIILDGRRGELAGRTPRETARIREMIASAARGQPGALRLGTEAGSGLSVLATPMAGHARDLKGAVLVTLSSDTKAAGPDAAVLQHLYDLSPAQASIAYQLSQGLTFEAAAMKRGISVATARTHFAAILRKSGAENLRDFLRRVASLPKIIAFCSSFPHFHLFA